MHLVQQKSYGHHNKGNKIVWIFFLNIYELRNFIYNYLFNKKNNNIKIKIIKYILILRWVFFGKCSIKVIRKLNIKEI